MKKNVLCILALSLMVFIPLYCISGSALTSFDPMPNYRFGFGGSYEPLIPDSIWSGLIISNTHPMFVKYSSSVQSPDLLYNVNMRGFLQNTTDVIFLFPDYVTATQYNFSVYVPNEYLSWEIIPEISFSLGYQPSTNSSNTSNWKMVSEAGNFYDVPDLYGHTSLNMVAFGFRIYKDPDYVGLSSGDFLIEFHFSSEDWPEHVSEDLPENYGSPLEAATNYLNRLTAFFNRLRGVYDCDALRDIGFVVVGGLVIGLICKFTL